MTVRQTTLVAFFIMLAACGSGDEGSSAPGLGANGLPNATAGVELSDAEGIAITQKSAGFRSGPGSSIGTGTITLDAGFVANSDNTGSGTLQIFGQEVTIVDGEGTLANGQTVNVNFEPSRSGQYAGAVEVVSYGSAQPGITNPRDGETHTVFGFETDPVTVNSFGVDTGSVLYSGGFQASGLVRNDAGIIVGANDGTEFEGAVEMNVDFASNTVAGSIEGSYDAGSGNVPVDLQMSSTAFDGNNFSGSLTCTSACASGSSVDATFYGPSAEELGGVVALDIVQDANDEEFNGVGTFIITPDAP